MKFIDIEESRIPALGFGTYNIRGKDCIEGVKDAISLGYRHIDTAQMYENEDEVGKGIQESEVNRTSLFLTTKVWYTNLKSKALQEAAHKSLRRLQTDYIDLLLIHWPNDNVPLEESLGAMSKLKEEGKVKHIGVSNFTPTLIDEAIKLAPIICNQVEYHPYLDQSTLMQKMAQHNLFLTAYCPIAKGKVLEDEVLQEIGKKYNKTAPQVALRWHMQQTDVAAIPRSSKRKRRKENLHVFDFELTSEEMQQISEKRGDNRMINPGWAPDWTR